MYNCLSTIQRLFMQAFYVSKLKLESSAGYNLFALCRIQLILYSQHFLRHTFVYWTVYSGKKKDRVIRSLEWHFLKQIFNPNKKSKRDLACSSNQIVCTQAGVIIEIQNTCRTISYFTLKTQHHEPWESKTFLSQGKCCHDCKVPQSQVLTVIKKNTMYLKR